MGIGKDVDLIVKSLSESENELFMMENNGIDRVMAKEYLPQVIKRTRLIKNDLQTFLNVLLEVEDEKYELIDDVRRHHSNVKQFISENIEKCTILDEKISKLI